TTIAHRSFFVSFFSCYGDHRDLHSFPTRRSSDLPFPLIKDHALISKATKLQEVHDEFTAKLNDDILREIVNSIPDEFLSWEEGPSNEEIREVYFKFLSNRLANADIFLKTAQDAR